MNVDWKFIRTLEGWESQGYVPMDRDVNDKVPSGVTIAAGYDLGQQTVQSVNSLKLNRKLFEKLLPYIGLKGIKARHALSKRPLELSAEELFELDTKVKEKYYKAVEKEFDDLSGTWFSSLDQAKQTVICSVAFQYGSLKRRCPTFFRYVINGMWYSAAAELENFGDAYATRRKKEAKLLRSSLPVKKGK